MRNEELLLKKIIVELEKEAVAQAAANDFNYVMRLYSQKMISASDAVAWGANTLRVYFRSPHFLTPSFRIDDFADAVRESLPRQFKTMESMFYKGCLMEGTLRFGGELNETRYFICDYFGESINTIKTAHDTFINFYYDRDTPRDQTNESFVEDCCHWVVSFVKSKPPKACEHPSAYKAFKKFYLASKAELAQKISYRIPPFGDYPRYIESIENADLPVKESN